MVRTYLVDLVDVALVEVVVHCDGGARDGGMVIGEEGGSESVGPKVSGEEDDGCGIIPRETAELATLLCPLTILGKLGLDLLEVGR